jgi:hypothetical protein
MLTVLIFVTYPGCISAEAQTALPTGYRNFLERLHNYSVGQEMPCILKNPEVK